jgi:hypothetical protein
VEIAGPITVEELQEADVLPAPKLPSEDARGRLQQILHRSNSRWIIVGVAGVLCLAGILFDPAIIADPKWWLPFLLILVLGLRFLFGSKFLWRRHQNRIERIPRVISIDSAGVRLQDRRNMLHFQPWSAYQSWREGSNIFVLRGAQKLSNIVPKRGLTPQQVDELRVLLAMYMPDCA